MGKYEIIGRNQVPKPPAAAGSLNPTFLGWTHAVVRDGGYIGDRPHFQPAALNSANRCFASGARAFDKNIDFLHPMSHRRIRRILRRHPRGEGGTLAAALKARRACARPRNHVARLIGHGDNGVVEGRVDMRLTVGYVLDDSFGGAASTGCSSLACHEKPLQTALYGKRAL